MLPQKQTLQPNWKATRASLPYFLQRAPPNLQQWPLTETYYCNSRDPTASFASNARRMGTRAVAALLLCRRRRMRRAGVRVSCGRRQRCAACISGAAAGTVAGADAAAQSRRGGAAPERRSRCRSHGAAPARGPCSGAAVHSSVHSSGLNGAAGLSTIVAGRSAEPKRSAAERAGRSAAELRACEIAGPGARLLSPDAGTSRGLGALRE